MLRYNQEVTNTAALLQERGLYMENEKQTLEQLFAAPGNEWRAKPFWSWNGELEEEKGFSAAVSLSDIAKQDYILTPGRYVGIEEQEDDGEPFEEKMTRLTSELSEMFQRSHQLEDEIRKKLGAIGYEI